MAGGLAKNALLMQIYADVLRLPISTIASEQGPALGSAIHAAVAAGAYPDVPTAAKAMGGVRKGVYIPDETRAAGLRPALRRVPRPARPLRPCTTTMRRLQGHSPRCRRRLGQRTES